MADGMDEEQLVSFCHQLGLAKDGYLSEADLSVVCRCIGLVASEEMMKQLFEELDGDRDGRVCLAELSLMLRGMQLQPQKTPSHDHSDKNNGPGTPGSDDTSSELPPLLAADADHFTFTIFDPHHKGFTQAGVITDLWSQLGINQNVGQQVLKELGFSVHSKASSINLQDLSRSIDDETDHSKDGDLPPVLLAALLTYRTEAQYLRTLCESVECERNKLRLDVAEAYQRSTLMAQEVDEQNARLERNTQTQLLKTESKCAEQLQALQERMGQEKESLLQTIHQLESQLGALRDVEDKLKMQISKLKEENAQLEKETKSLSEEVKHVTWMKTKVANELTRYVELDKGMQDAERLASAQISEGEAKLRRSHEEIQSLKDQNDELSSQLERMKDALDGMKSLEGKRSQLRRRRKKGPSPRQSEEPLKVDDDQSCVPLQKMGKFHQEIANGVEHDLEEAESSLEHVFLSCSSQGIDSGNFQTLDRIHLDSYVVDESCTEPMHEDTDEASMNDRNENGAENLQFNQNDQPCSRQEEESVSANTNRILELEKQLEEIKSAFENERSQLRAQCSDVERSLELLQMEYEKCEEYWHGKLQEERVEYEHDRNVNDEKFLELSEKIKEYEELCLQHVELSNKLPPIEERDSLEKQVNELDDECSRLEEQVKALQQKCQEYETRLAAVTEGDTETTAALQARVQELKTELRVQKERHTEHLQDLERSWKRKSEGQKSSQGQEQSPGSSSSQPLRIGTSREAFGAQHQVGLFWTQAQNHVPFYNFQSDQPLSLPYVPSTSTYGGTFAPEQLQNGFGLDLWSLAPAPQQLSHMPQSRKAWCHVEVGWLQALRMKLKQREEQCVMLQRALCSLDQQHEKIISEMRFQHRAEISSWEDLMKGSQELVRQQTAKQKEQVDKLAHADAVMKDLWSENNKLSGALQSAQHRITFLESLLKNSNNNNLSSVGNAP